MSSTFSFEESKTKAAIVNFGIGGDTTLHPLVSFAYKIGLFCQTKDFEEYSPLYTNIPADAIFDPTESGPFTNYVTWNANASVGTEAVYGTAGMNRMGFGPFYGDYRILLLDEGYQWVLVGGSSDEFLWILSRTPQLTDEVRETILSESARRGYDISKLIWVEQQKQS